MHPRRARVVTIIRMLRAAGPVARRRRVPRQQQPDGIRVAYYAAIRDRFVAPMQRSFAMVRDEVVRLLEDERALQRKDGARADAGDNEKRARELVDRAARRAADQLDGRELREVAEQFGKRTSAHQREQLDRQVRAAVGVPYNAIEAPVRDRVEGFVSENVSLIKSISERYFDSLRAEVQQAFETGEHPETFARRLRDRDGVADWDARRIARDQIGKLNAQVNRDRQEAMGVSGYVWRGAMDNRERDEHREREGQRFAWADPPPDGHPGEPILCRCQADPLFDEIKEEVEAEEPAVLREAPAPDVAGPAEEVEETKARAEPEEEAVRSRARALVGTLRDADLQGRMPDDVATAPRPLAPGQKLPTLKQARSKVIDDPVYGKVWEVDVSSLDDVPAMVWRGASGNRIAEWYAEGRKELLDMPIKVGEDGKGGRGLADGMHRLSVARLVGAKRIRVRFLDLED